MRHLSGETKLTPSLLPSTSHIDLHANPMHLGQFISTDYPFPAADRKTIAQSIHQRHLKNSTGKELTADEAWQLASASDKDSSFRHAQDIPNKLRAAGLWFRKARAPVALDANPHPKLEEMLEALAIQEHDRWVASKRRDGYVPTASPADAKDELRLVHNCLFRWEELSDKVKQYDRDLVRTIPVHLAAAGYEIFKP